MAGRGLTPNQLRELLAEHGSYEGAIEARPDLAEALKSARTLDETTKASFSAILNRFTPPALPRAPAFLDSDALIEHEASKTRREAQIAADLAALRRAAERGPADLTADDDDLVDKRSRPDELDRSKFNAAYDMLGEEKPNMRAIAREVRLSYRQVVKIRDVRRGARRGDPAYAVYPGSIPGRVRILKLKKPRS